MPLFFPFYSFKEHWNIPGKAVRHNAVGFRFDGRGFGLNPIALVSLMCQHGEAKLFNHT